MKTVKKHLIPLALPSLLLCLPAAPVQAARIEPSVDTIAVDTIAADTIAVDTIAVTTPLPQERPDTLHRYDNALTEQVEVRKQDEDKVLVSIGGIGLALSSNRDPERKPSRFFVTLCSFEIGMTTLTQVDYGPRPDDMPDYLNQILGKSGHVGGEVCAFNLAVGRKRLSSFGFGLRTTMENLHFSNTSYTLGNEGPRIVPVLLETPAKKSKLRYSTFGFELRYRQSLGNNFYLTLSTHYDFTTEVYAITKSPKQKERLSGLQTFRFGVGFSLTYAHVGGFFIRYSPTSLFKPSTGLKAGTMTFGVTMLL